MKFKPTVSPRWDRSVTSSFGQHQLTSRKIGSNSKGDNFQTHFTDWYPEHFHLPMWFISIECNQTNSREMIPRWEEWRDKVSFCSLIRFNWRVPARVSFVLAWTLGTQRHSGRLLTHYRPREARNSIYRYRKIHIDYRSKFSYRFISSISIIYGNTTNHTSKLTLVHAMAWCHQAISYYLVMWHQ